jgi:hypothetical protein
MKCLNYISGSSTTSIIVERRQKDVSAIQVMVKAMVAVSTDINETQIVSKHNVAFPDSEMWL